MKVIQEISPKINDIYCFYRFVGDWKTISPEAVIARKRDADKLVHVNRHLLSGTFIKSYDEFMSALFDTYSEYGEDAKIKSAIKNRDGDRRTHREYDWKSDYDHMFKESDATSYEFLDERYTEIIREFKEMLRLPDD